MARKQHLNYYLTQIVLLVGFILVLFHSFFFPLNQFPYTHDGQNHLARFANYKVAVKEGQWPPRFAPNLLNHYGYPVFNYNYPLANILSLPLSFIGLNYELTFKVIGFFFLVFGGLGVAAWLEQLFNQRLSLWQVIAINLVYLSSPYLANLIYFRGSIGEIMVWGLLPWLFWLVEKLKTKDQFPDSTWAWIFSLGVSSSFLLAHNVSVMLVLVILTPWALFRWGDQGLAILLNRIKNTILWFILPSIGLTLWFWLPALVEMNQVVVASASLQKEYLGHLVSFQELIYSPLQFGFSYPGHINSLSFWLGFVNLAALIFGLGWLVIAFYLFLDKKNKLKMPSWFWLSLGFSLMLIFFITWPSHPYWALARPLRFIQFPWRLMLWLNILLLPVVTWLLNRDKFFFRWVFVIFLGAELMLLSQVKAFEHFHHPILFYDLFSQSTSTNNENRAVNFSYNNFGDWQPSARVLEGEGEITVGYWTGSKRSYRVELKTPAVIVEPTMYFLGWQTLVKNLNQSDARWQKLSYVNNDQIQGRLAYRLEVGNWEIKTQFTQKTPARILGNFSFWFTLTVVFVLTKKKWIG